MNPDDLDPDRDGSAERAAMRSLYRAASERLGEAPSPGVRAAVLAVATREAKAATPAAAPRLGTVGRERPKWLGSAAAVLIVSLATGLVAQRALRDSPERVTTVARADVASPDPATEATGAAPREPIVRARDVGPRAAPERAERASDLRPPSPAASSPEAMRRAIAAAPLAVDRAAAQPAPAPAPAPVRSIAVAPAANVAAPAPFPGPAVEASAAAPAPAAMPPLAKPEPSLDASVASSQAVSPGALPRPAAVAPQRAKSTASVLDRAEPTPDATASDVGSSKTTRPRAFAEASTPAAWVARIVALREAGDDDEADRELAALRRRFPSYEIPAAARAPAGTR